MSEPPRELPPALASLAAVLELSQGFALAFVTGPRDHRDSVWLRLVRALGDRFELRRHRLDRDGMPQLADLAGGADDRPSVVFLSGLENMPDEPRQDITARLNLVRDAWAPHPARVIFWLPAWGLAEFRRLAPDLFHWRSNLTVLHDADLPVRDELEYLVWACERYKPPQRALAMSSIDASAPGPVGSRREVRVGYGTVARQTILRAMVRILTRNRIPILLGSSGVPGVGDLDGLAQQSSSPVFADLNEAPILLRATDLAGRLEAEPSWTLLCELAGIPGFSMVAPQLADLAEHGELAVLLDGIDQLDLGPGSPGERLVSWLDRDYPQLWIFIMTAGPPPPLLRAWTIRPEENAESISPDHLMRQGMNTTGTLVFLLQDLFPAPDELCLLADHLFGRELTDSLPTFSTRRSMALAFVVACERRGLLDAAFFEELKRLRPSRAGDIDAAARAYLGA